MSPLSCLWWNVWLDNFGSRQRESELLDALAEKLDDGRPAVVSLQEVIAGRDGRGAIAELLRSRGYTHHFAPVMRRSDDRFMGNMIASRRPFEYETYDCGSYGERATPLQVLTLTDAPARVSIGNTHWLMMRPQFEMHRWRQMSRMVAIVDLLRENGRPLVIGGDLNTAAHHPYIIRLRRRYHMLWDSRPTWWYMARSPLIKASLDHVFATDPVSNSFELLDRGPSDHAPMLVHLDARMSSL